MAWSLPGTAPGPMRADDAAVDLGGSRRTCGSSPWTSARSDVAGGSGSLGTSSARDTPLSVWVQAKPQLVGRVRPGGSPTVFVDAEGPFPAARAIIAAHA